KPPRGGAGRWAAARGERLLRERIRVVLATVHRLCAGRLPIARPPAFVEDRAEAGEEIQTLHRFVDLLGVGLMGVLKHVHRLTRGNDHSVDRRLAVLKIRYSDDADDDRAETDD